MWNKWELKMMTTNFPLVITSSSGIFPVICGKVHFPLVHECSICVQQQIIHVANALDWGISLDVTSSETEMTFSFTDGQE